MSFKMPLSRSHSVGNCGGGFFAAGSVGHTRCRLPSIAMALFAAFAALGASAECPVAAESKPSIAVLGVQFINDNAGYQPTSEEERARLIKLEELLKSKLADSGRYSLIALPPELRKRIEAGQTIGACGGCEVEYGRSLDAQQVAWITLQKVSNLILNMTLVLEDVREQKLVFIKAVDIRSNTDESWLRSITYILKNYLLAETHQQAPSKDASTSIQH